MGSSEQENSSSEFEESKPTKRPRSTSTKSTENNGNVKSESNFEKTKEGEYFSSLDTKATKNKKRVTVRKFKDTVYVDIREFYESKEGQLLPGKKGISLTLEQWEILKKLGPEIDTCVEKL